MDSSIVVSPDSTRPSTGIFEPGFTSKMSSISTSSIGISASISIPVEGFLRTIIAVFAERDISFFIASLVFPFEIDSSVLPSRIRVIIVPADSK